MERKSQSDEEQAATVQETGFTVNMLKNDFKILKQYLKTQKVDEIGHALQQVNQFEEELEIVKESTERAASKLELE